MFILRFVLEYFIIVGGVALFKTFGWLGLASLAWPAVWAVGLAWLATAFLIAVVVVVFKVAAE